MNDSGDDRLRLFSFTTAEKRADYLWVLRAFDTARANYVVLLHAGDVADLLDRIADDDSGRLTSAEITPLLEQLHAWGILERSYDGSRAATLAEYRNRHFVYQFAQAGYLVFRAVEDVLGARLEDATLSRLTLPDLLADLEELAAANRHGDADLIYRKLSRLDATLTDMAARAAQFYLMLGDLVRTTEITPEAFLAHKDALLRHMQEFSSDLARYAPKLAAAIAAIEGSGVDELIARAATSDERVFLSREERESDWRARWSGLAQWFVGVTGPSESERLREGTMSAIAAVLSLLRRVTETRRGGVSRESQLRHLAGWFAATPSEESAHTLFELVFDLGRPRHLSMVHPDADIIPESRSWWDATPVEISRTLAETGRPASPGAPSKVQRNEGGIRRLRENQLASQRARAVAASSLATNGAYDRVLDVEETDVLLSLLNAALTARVPVSGAIADSTGSDSGVRLTLSPHTAPTVVQTARGRLYLDGLQVSVQ
nr:TIGR02677 family protein [Prescottella subtropica]